MGNSYLPYSGYTDEELCRALYTRDDLTDLELELSHRLEKVLDFVRDMEEDVGNDPGE